MILRTLRCLIITSFVALGIASAAPVTIPISVTSALSFSPSPLIFPPTIVGSSAQLTLTAKNSGTVQIGIASLVLSGSAASDYSYVSHCGSSVPANTGSCTIDVTFAPSASGTRNATLTLTSTATTPHLYNVAISNQPGDGALAYYVAPGGNDNNAGTLTAPFATLSKCQIAMQGSSIKTCYLRSGTYAIGSSILLTSADNGERWDYYPADGVNSAKLTQGSAFTFFSLTGTNGIIIDGLMATGFQHTAHGSCSGAQFVNGNGSGSGNGPANLTVTNNILSNFDCGIVVQECTNTVVSFNQLSVVEYANIVLNHCAGVSASTHTLVQGNIIWDINPDGADATNAYGITFSTTANGSSSNYTAQNNKIFHNSTWTCFDDHAGVNIYWINNLCVGPGHYTAFNAANPNVSFAMSNVRQLNNVADNGFNGTAVVVDAYVNCGSSGCNSDAGISGGVTQGNVTLMGIGNGSIIETSPSVTVNGNIGGINPETVSSINFAGGGVSASYTHGQPGAVVATFSVNMSNSYWAFSFPPGHLAIGGPNAGQFVICNGNQICQGSNGSPLGTFHDFSIAASLTGMYNSPYVQVAGTLTLVGQ